MPKEIDDFSVCGENWYSITEVQEILEQLQKTRLWLEAGGNEDQEILADITYAQGSAIELKGYLLDLQIKLLTVL
jgi:hypothetical protein